MDCTHTFPSFRRFECALVVFWPKNCCFWPKIAVSETEVRPLRIPFPAATVEFFAHTLCDGTSHPWVSSTKISAESEAPRPIWRVLLLACCLLACFLVAAAKPGRSTLDTKKGYNTKTGSGSSVTLTLALTLALIKTEYWDRAGGGGNISYDW